ncbi:MAG: ammonia channel protein, partial [Pseudomonadales bacterium]
MDPKRLVAVTGPLTLLFPSVLVAQDLVSSNTAWIMTSTALVLFMTIPGLSLFYAGLVRSKNVLSVFMQCFTITCVASLVWFVAGYSLAFGDGGSANAFIGDLSNLMF